MTASGFYSLGSGWGKSLPRWLCLPKRCYFHHLISYFPQLALCFPRANPRPTWGDQMLKRAEMTVEESALERSLDSSQAPDSPMTEFTSKEGPEHPHESLAQPGALGLVLARPCLPPNLGDPV